jgi:F-type H+-transporting ATPase subunit a
MAGITILASESILNHLEPRYAWHWPGFEVHLDRANHWVQGILGFNPDITTHIVMMVAAALFTLLFFIPVARRYVDVPRGMRNFLEPVLLFVRDEMVYPWMGEHDGRTYLPFIWTLFFFILAMNLIGLLPAPFAVTPTGNFNITGALALMTLLVGIIGGMVKKGTLKYWWSLVPPGAPPGIFGLFLKVFILILEFIGMIARHIALMVRLFANMTAGHAILAVLALWLTFAPAMVPIRAFQAFGSVAMVCFEIFIALVQAYVFAILAAIYIGLSLAEEH